MQKTAPVPFPVLRKLQISMCNTLQPFDLDTQLMFMPDIGYLQRNVKVGNDQEKAQSERNSHSKNRGGKTTLAIRYLYLENLSLMSRIVRKPDYCLCENKGADQLRSNCEADQRLCFRYSDSTISLLLIAKISSL